MKTKLNWNMLHFTQCPKCAANLIPASADQEVFVCRNSFEKGRAHCDFKIKTFKITKVTNSLKLRVY